MIEAVQRATVAEKGQPSQPKDGNCQSRTQKQGRRAVKGVPKRSIGGAPGTGRAKFLICRQNEAQKPAGRRAHLSPTCRFVAVEPQGPALDHRRAP